MADFQPYRTSDDLAWCRGVPAAYWLEDYPHGEMWDSDFHLAGIRTVVIDGLRPRRPDVHVSDEAKACRNLSIGTLPILRRVYEARLASVALEADLSLDYNAPELHAIYERDDQLDAEFHEYFGTVELDGNRVVIAFGPAAPIRRFLQAGSPQHPTPHGGS
jgi:hypothetical protein